MTERNIDMRDTIDGASFQRMVIHAAASINSRKQEINELNVFPVPDGDTGTNMSLTISTAAAEMKKKGRRHRGRGRRHERLRPAAGRPGQLRRDSVPAVPGILQGREGQGDHRRPGPGRGPGLGRGRRLQGGHEARRGHHPHRLPPGRRSGRRHRPGEQQRGGRPSGPPSRRATSPWTTPSTRTRCSRRPAWWTPAARASW